MMLFWQDLMVDPCILCETGVSYERSSIETWVASSGCDSNTTNLLVSAIETLVSAIETIYVVEMALTESLSMHRLTNINMRIK